MSDTNGPDRGHSGKKDNAKREERLRSGQVDRPNPPPGEAWGIVGTLVGGGGFWGLVGFGVDRLFGFDALFFPIGLIVGVVAAIYLVIYRFGARR
ncbi:hypothetical protein [Frankia sp. EI5c]|uniref:hypothetical protein n=1 Tax=Frankia sp. EI5c TaxID=683316 RepID=UPI001F5B89D7|nr:hypothetical protein [Frankia sp. EI5c]